MQSTMSGANLQQKHLEPSEKAEGDNSGEMNNSEEEEDIWSNYVG